MKPYAVMAGLALLVSPAAEARAAPANWCRINPDRLGACRTVHGRMFFANGTPSLRIWVVGTRRILGVAGSRTRGGEDLDGLPRNLRAAVGEGAFGTEVYADFRICPLTRERAGWMQFVCVAAAHRLYVVRL